MGELGHWYGGGTPSKARADFWTDGDIPWVSPKDMKTPKIQDAQDHITKAAVKGSSTSLVPSGSVLVVVRSGILKHTLPVAITEREVALNQDLKAITPKEDILPEYLALGLKAFERKILDECCKDGTTVQNIKTPSFLRFEMPVAPLPEQRRIVARIEELFSRLDAGVAALRQAKAQLQRYRQSVLAAAVTGQLTQEWREQHPETESAEELLERILDQRREQWDGRGKYKEPEPITPETCEWSLCTPENWALVSMEILIEAPQYGTSKKCSYEIEGSSVLRIPNVINGFVDSADLKFAKFDDSEIANYSLRENDLLMVRSNGSLSIVGKTALVRSQDQNHLYAGYLIRLRPIASSVAGRFLSHALAAPPLRAQIESKAKSTSGVNNINAKEIQSLVLQLPPLAEQHQIVAQVEARTTAIDHLEAELDRQITRSNRLRQSTLNFAFRGKLA